LELKIMYYVDDDVARSDYRFDPLRASEPPQLKLITPPAVTPVSVAQCKEHLRIEHSDHDALLVDMVEAATNSAEKYTGRSFVRRTYEQRLATFSAVMSLYRPNLISVNSFKYIDDQGVEQTLDASEYVVDTFSEPGRVYLAYDKQYPSVRFERGAVRINYDAGYQDSGASPADLTDRIPGAIKIAIKMFTGHFYEARETTSFARFAADSVFEVPMGTKYLLEQYRVRTI